MEMKVLDEKSEAVDKTWENVKLFKTVMLVFPFVAMGMTHSIQYTTIPDMRIRLDVGTQEISYAMSFGTIGGLFGGPMGSIADRFSNFSDIIIALTLFLVGGSYSLFPWSPTVWFLGILDFVFSLGWGLYQAAAHSVITHVWGSEGGPARYAIHFGYPIGSMLGPLIAIPFVSGEEPSSNITTTESPAAAQPAWYERYASILLAEPEVYESMVESKWFDDGSSIEYAYFIVALFIALVGVVFVILQFCRTRMVSTMSSDILPEERSFAQVLSPSEWADGDGRFGLTILILMMVYFVLQTGTHKGTQEYLVTYAVDSGMFTNQEAAALNSVVYGSGALARALAIFVAKYVTAPYILFTAAHGQLFFAILCLIFGTQSALGLWILAPCFGFFRELMWPTGFAWTDYYIILLGVVVGLLDMVAMFFNIFLIILQGYLYDNAGIESIFYTTVFFGTLLCLHLYLMTIYASRKGGRKYRALKKLDEDGFDIVLESTKL